MNAFLKILAGIVCALSGFIIGDILHQLDTPIAAILILAAFMFMVGFSAVNFIFEVIDDFFKE